MKKRLLIVALVAAVALVALHFSRSEPVANTDLAQVSTLQQAVGSSTEADLSASRGPCMTCAKDPTRCLHSCQQDPCPSGCN